MKFVLPRRLRKSANWWWVGERGILGEKRKKEIEKRNVATITRWVVIFNLLNCCCCLVACATIQFWIIIITFSCFFLCFFSHSIVVLGVTLNQKNTLLSVLYQFLFFFFFEGYRFLFINNGLVVYTQKIIIYPENDNLVH